MAEILLNCSIIGLNDASVFSVRILPSETVDFMKKAIKKEKEPELNHIAADRLVIRKVSDPYSPFLVCSDTIRLQLKNPLPTEEIIKSLAPIDILDADNLDPVKKLSRYFPEAPVEEMIHLVVQVPSGEHQACTTSHTARVVPMSSPTLISRRLSAAYFILGISPSTSQSSNQSEPHVLGKFRRPARPNLVNYNVVLQSD
jgi:hypothetical protein